MSTIFFLLCTAHVGASLQQLLEAFVYAPADVPDYSTLYWLDNTTTLRMLKNNLYDTLVRNPYMLVYQGHAQGNIKGTFPRVHASRFNMATMVCPEIHTCYQSDLATLCGFHVRLEGCHISCRS